MGMEVEVGGKQKVSPVPRKNPCLQQCTDLLMLQEEVCSFLQRKVVQNISRDDYGHLYSELQDERVEHAKTKTLLVSEEEKLQFANREIEILKTQLEREKTTFERAFGLLKSQALSDSSKAEHLLAKCTALETLCTRKDEELASKEEEIIKLRQQMKKAEEAHKRELQELNIRMQQEVYMASKLNETGLKKSRRKHL